ncbi:DNA-binding protein [Kitasatospora sp. NBC_01560]|uniref:DNA-binding protein n=1 Tax=Kitasatospora sp. NBC_01560 TaxID=2975965 RepID=UPI0038666333
MSDRIETVVLDSQGLSAWFSHDRGTLAMIRSFHSMAADLVVCANTIVEVVHARVNTPRLNWALSQVRIEPVTEQAARASAKLLIQAGLHGHKHAIDATVAEVALRQPGPVAVLTSDVDDMVKLCGSRVRVIAV